VGRNVEIERAQLAVAAKDLSRVEIERVTIQNSHTAFGVFQKKPEFGSADMTVLNSTVKGVEILYRLEKGSSLSINRKSMQPNPAAVTPADPGGRHAG